MFSFWYMISILLQFQSMLLLRHDHKIEYIFLFIHFIPFSTDTSFLVQFDKLLVWYFGVFSLAFTWKLFSTLKMPTFRTFASNVSNSKMPRWRCIELLRNWFSKTENVMEPFWNEKKRWENLTETVDFLRHDSHGSKRLLVIRPSNKCVS